MIRRAARRLPYTDWGNRLYWRIGFTRRFRRRPELRPRRFVDHLHSIKTDGRMADPLYQYCTDKEYAKSYIAGVLGPGFTPETYAVLRSDADIDAFAPDRAPCVIKPTHASGQTMFLRGADEPVDRDTLKAWLRLDYYRVEREANYRHLTPKIMVEELFSDGRGPIPKDYKVLCIAGWPTIIQVTSDRVTKPATNYYDTGWNEAGFTWAHPPGPPADRPALLEDMLDIAARLAAPFSFVRVDLYASDEKIRVGELTFCPFAAKARVYPESADFELGRLFSKGLAGDPPRSGPYDRP